MKFYKWLFKKIPSLRYKIDYYYTSPFTNTTKKKIIYLLFYVYLNKMSEQSNLINKLFVVANNKFLIKHGAK